MFHHIGIEVSNIENSQHFYNKLLNFQYETTFEFFDEKIVFLTNQQIKLELIEKDGDVKSQGNLHICFSVDNLIKMLKRAKREGIPILEGPYDLHNGWKIVFMEGPDGEIIELLEDSNKHPG